MTQTIKQHSIGREAAIAMYESNWWVGKEPKEIALVGLMTRELCLPFEKLHESVENALGRPVWTHEFALNFDAIILELRGEKDAPTMDDIIGLIPESKRIMVKIA